jgi:hypothetical protein
MADEERPLNSSQGRSRVRALGRMAFLQARVLIARGFGGLPMARCWMLLRRLFTLPEQFLAAMFGVDEDVVGIAQPFLPRLANLAVAAPVVEFAVVQCPQLSRS